MTTRSIPLGTLRQCPDCHAPAVDPFPDAWNLDLIKEGPPSGPVAVFYTPHTDTCTTPVADPQPGLAVRVSGRSVTNLTIDLPPVPRRPRFGAGGYIPTGATMWQPGRDPIDDLRAAQQAVENEPYRPGTTYLTGRTYRTLREIMNRINTERANRANIDGLIYVAPLSTDPPPPDNPPDGEGWTNIGHTVDWTQLGHTDDGFAANEHGEYVRPAGPPDLGPGIIAEPGTLWTDPQDSHPHRDSHIHWAGPTPDRRKEADNAIYGGPPADPEPQPDTSPGPAAE